MGSRGTTARRKLPLEWWLASWMAGLVAVSTLTGCQLILADCVCRACLDVLGGGSASGEITEFEVIRPQDGDTLTGAVTCQFSFAIDSDEDTLDGVVLTNWEGIGVEWDAHAGGSIDCTPTGDSGDVPYTFTARSNRADGEELQTAVVHWIAQPTVTIQLCDEVNPTTCATLGTATPAVGTATFRVVLDVDQQRINATTVTISDGATVLATQTEFDDAVSIDVSTLPAGVHAVDVTIERVIGPELTATGSIQTSGTAN